MTVYFIGAGIGGVDYLTLKAKGLISQGEVVIYDDLIDKDILNIAPVDSVKIFVGKRGGKVSTSQGEINQLLIKYASNYQSVIRLKGGDIGIFGRINEELKALQTINADYQLIPGISSAFAVPLWGGIMLTEKNHSRSFTVLTAHDIDTIDWENMAKIDTLVILMGGRNLPLIVEKLQKYGRSHSFPIAIIKEGGSKNQRVWRGTLGNIVEQTLNISLSPCVIVIGKVVNYQY